MSGTRPKHETTWNDYQQRILRVLTHIQEHLDEALDLDELAQVPLLDVMVASGASPAVAWEKWQAAASISVADEVWWQTTIAFERDVIGTGPANLTGLLSALERP